MNHTIEGLEASDEEVASFMMDRIAQGLPVTITLKGCRPDQFESIEDALATLVANMTMHSHETTGRLVQIGFEAEGDTVTLTLTPGGPSAVAGLKEAGKPAFPSKPPVSGPPPH